MKFSCMQENIHQGLSIVGHLASKNVSLPILNNVLVRAEGGVIKLSTTNLEQAIVSEVRGKIDQDGSFTANAKLLGEYISLLPNERIDVDLKDQDMHIIVKNSKTTVRGVDASEFPLIPEVEKGVECTILEGELRKALAQVAFAVAQDESRPEISGVHMRLSENTATLVATDSYRLAEKTIAVRKKGSDRSLILPIRTVLELLRLLRESDDELIIRLNESQVSFTSGGTTLTSRIIEGQFPDYKQIIPTSHRTKVTIPTQKLAISVRTASLFCKPGVNDVSMKFDPQAGKAIISASNAQLGENETEVPCTIEGDENAIVFNFRYLLDGLQNIGHDELTLEINNNATPGILKPGGAQDYLYLIMPIKQ